MIRIPNTVAKWSLIALGAFPAFWLGGHQFGGDKHHGHTTSLDSVQQAEPVITERSKDTVATQAEPSVVWQKKGNEIPRPSSRLAAQRGTKAKNTPFSPVTADINAYVSEIENEYRQALQK